MKVGYLSSVLISASLEAFLVSAQIKIVNDEQHAKDLGLKFLLSGNQSLQLKRLSDGVTLNLDFTQGKLQYRTQRLGKDSELLLKAISAKPKLSVLDATAGLGRDAFIMASCGCDVLMCERNPVVYLLLADALKRLNKDDLTGDIQLLSEDSLAYFQRNHIDNPAVIYLDPMFPSRKKSSAVKKEMQMLQEIAGVDPDIDQLIEQALDVAEYRVVLKRPLKSPVLENFKPTMQFKGSSTRFDVIVKKKL